MRVLVSVSSRHGGTREMGQVVAAVLRDAGHDVAEIGPDEVEDVTGYDAVVLGSAVYVGRLALGVRDLVDRRAGQLRERPAWLFWSGPVGEPASAPVVPDDVTEVAKAVGARGVRMFPGRLERAELNISERALVALVHAQPGDYRDLEEVRDWALGIDEELRALAREADSDTF
ncbi:flavodoxin domain-containing protein [Cellulomonas sp. SG140]|uniref:flavodoxin domain-containing protein n=1 Tax=Cellulomonas sp. SG140 TaxID=2976536 RepID=UPI0021E7B56A|nr:flavodoxin domain-containing protein [Cellulomonas sp. SG140]